MKVYIAVHGEQCEGYGVVSVHTKKENAITAAKEMRTCFDGGWQEDGDDSWINGCDFIQVLEEEVLE